jgi:ribosomal-protein-serine acetyltransferase
MLHIELSDGRWLRLLEESDAEDLHSVVEANRDYLARWMPWAARQTLEDTVGFIRDTRKQLTDNNGFQTVIVDHERIVGMAGFHGLSWQVRSTSLGYWLAESAQGRGTMTRSVAALVDHAFGVWQLDRVEIRARVTNAPSRAVAQRLGFKQEGILRDDERVGGRYVDRVLYVMRVGEWQAQD